jgi:glutamine amidotransferase
MTVIIINSGVGNCGSIANIIHKVGGKAIITDDANLIEGAKKLILPGVGSFDRAINCLKKGGTFSVIKKAAENKIPILGICLGMQMMMEFSEEGQMSGLGFISGKVKKFQIGKEHPPIPNLGWSKLNIKKNSKLFDENIEHRFYFAHSYHVCCENSSDIIATSIFGDEFIAAFQRDNIYGVQFHPEKSHKFGFDFFRKFISI